MFFLFLSFFSLRLVEKLVREWAPLVWLAPNEKFMPGDVTEFLQHMHAEKVKISKNNGNTQDQQFQTDDGDDEQLYYYETANELNVILSQQDRNPWERRHKRMYKDNYLFNYIIDLPIGEHSSNWYLVTNDNIGTHRFHFFLLNYHYRESYNGMIESQR